MQASISPSPDSIPLKRLRALNAGDWIFWCSRKWEAIFLVAQWTRRFRERQEKEKRKADTAEGESASEEEERRQTDSQLASQSRFETSQAGIQIPWSTSRGSQVLKWHPQMSLGTCVAVTCPPSPLSFPNMSPGKFSGKVVFFVGEMNKCLFVCLFYGLVFVLVI